MNDGTDTVTNVENFSFADGTYDQTNVLSYIEDTPDNGASDTSGSVTNWGTVADDTIFGSADADNLGGGDGNDTIYAGAGDDLIADGLGADELHGGAGADHIYGGDDNDLIYGDEGNDYITGDAGNDEIHGGSGNDIIYGGDGDDVIRGGTGDDQLYAGAGNDDFLIQAGDGNDTIWGSYGGGWTDSISLVGMDGAVTIDGNTVTGNGWTMEVTSGTIGAQNGESLTLSDDSWGTITFDNGDVVHFSDMEQVNW